MLLFSQQFATCFPPPKLLAMVAPTGFACAAVLAAYGSSAFFGPPFALPLLATVAWLALGLIRGSSPEGFSLVFMPCAASAAAACLSAVLAARPAERVRLLSALALAHLVTGLYAVAQHFGLDPWTWTLEYGHGRVFSTFGNPNFLAGQMVLVLPVLAALGSSAGGSLKWLARSACVAGLFAMIYAQTRSAMIGLLAGAAVAAAAAGAASRKTFGFRLMPHAWLIVAVAVPAIVYSVPALNREGISLPSQLASSFELDQQSARQRFFWWRAAFELFRAAPLTGHGTGGFAREFPPCSRRVSGPYRDLYPAFCDHPHNDYLFILCEQGMLGLGLMIWVGATWLRLLLAGASRGDPVRTGTLAGLAGVAVHAVWNMPFVIQPTIFTAGCLLGLTGARRAADATHRVTEPEPRSRPIGPRTLGPRPLVLAAGIVATLGLAYRPASLLVAQSYMNGARILGEKRQYAPAAFLARRTMKLTRAPWRVHFMLGGIMYGQQYYGEALAAFEQDERENPFGADAILHQGKTLRQMNRFEEADVQCRRALRLVPNYPEAAVTIASLAYFRAEEARKTGGSRETALHLRHARVWLNYALNFFPRNAEALKLEGFVDIRERRWHDAASAWERYLSVKPADAEMRFRLDALRQDRLGKDRR